MMATVKKQDVPPPKAKAGGKIKPGASSGSGKTKAPPLSKIKGGGC